SDDGLTPDPDLAFLIRDPHDLYLNRPSRRTPETLGPLDRNHRIPGIDDLFQTKLRQPLVAARLAAMRPVESIEIHVIERQSPAVFIHERKCGAGHVGRLDTQAGSDAFHEQRLPRTELSFEKQHGAGRGLFAESDSELKRLER